MAEESIELTHLRTTLRGLQEAVVAAGYKLSVPFDKHG
jgi:hypothetical protein